MPFWLAVVLGFAIVARATRFLNSDVMAEPIRTLVMRWFGDGRMYYLVTCPWCASIWLALPVALLAVLAFSPLTGFAAVWAIAGLWLGYSWLYGLVASNVDGD